MKVTKRIASIFAAVLLAIFIGGCGSGFAGTSATPASLQAETEQTASREAVANETPGEDLFPMTVKDDTGYELTIAEKPSGIVSLTLGSDEMLLGIVEQSRIKALTIYADDPGISNIAGKAEEVKERLDSNAERVIALSPDLVIIDTWATPDFVKQVRDAGINVFVFKTPSSIDEQKTTIRKIASLVGEAEKGGELTDWMDFRLMEIETRLAALLPEERLTVMDYGEMGSSGSGTNLDDLVTRAGLINVVARAGLEGWPQISKEKLIEFNPDIILLPSWFYDEQNTVEGFKNSIKNDQSLQSVSAVRNDRLYALPNPHLSAISQYVVLGVEDAARAAYPDLFE